MGGLLLLDTSVLIEVGRGRPGAAAYLESLPPTPLISAITLTELFTGARNESERRRLDTLSSHLEVLPVTAELARTAGILRQAHGTAVADAIIAATAIATGATLLTFNTRHFQMLGRVEEPYRRQ